MKRKILIISVVTVVSTVLVMFAIKLYSNSTKYDHVKVMPSVELTKQDGTLSNLLTVDSSKATAIIFFNPGYEICVHEIDDFIAHKEQLSDINMVFVTNTDSTSLANFTDKHPINQISTATVLIDSKNKFSITFLPEATPMCYIYNKDRQLLKVRPAGVTVETILKTITVR